MAEYGSTPTDLRSVALDEMSRLRRDYRFNRCSLIHQGTVTPRTDLNCLTGSIVYSDRIGSRNITSRPIFLPTRHFSTSKAFHFGVVLQNDTHITIADPTLLQHGYAYGRVGEQVPRDFVLNDNSCYYFDPGCDLDPDLVLYPSFVMVNSDFVAQLNNLRSMALAACDGKTERSDRPRLVAELTAFPVPTNISSAKEELYYLAGKLLVMDGLYDQAFYQFQLAHSMGTLNERSLAQILGMPASSTSSQKETISKEYNSILTQKSKQIRQIIGVWKEKSQCSYYDSETRHYFLSLVDYFSLKLKKYKDALC